MPPQMNIDVRLELPTLASHLPLLHESHIRWLPAALGGLLDRSELRFMARDILPQGPPNPLRVPGAYDDAGKQLSAELKTKYSDWPYMNVAAFVKSVYAE